MTFQSCTGLPGISASIHSDLSALVAESWNAMPDVVLGIRFHHTPEFVAPEGGRRVANLLRASDLVGRECMAMVIEKDGGNTGLGDILPVPTKGGKAA